MTSEKPDKIRSLSRPNDWTDVLAPEIISQFLGKHIAIVYKRVVASGPSFDAVFEECVKLFPEETPYMAYIPTKEESQDEQFKAAATQIADQKTAVPEVGSPTAHPTVTAMESIRTAGRPIDASISPITFTPERGAAGTAVTILGEKFTGTNQVLFGDVPASTVTIVSDTSIFVLVPEGAITSYITVSSLTESVISGSQFIIPSPPQVESVSPPQGGIGSKITISGFFFSSPIGVCFEGAEQSVILSASESSIVVEVPINARTGKVTVETTGGTGQSAQEFVVLPPTMITSFQPLAAATGESVTLFGKSLSDIKQVFVGATEAPEFLIRSDDSVVVKIPDGISGGQFTVQTPGGSFVSEIPLKVLPAPLVASFSPPATATNTVISVYGEHFDDVKSVRINDIAATEYHVVSSSILEVRVPILATSGPVVVETRGGRAVSEESLTVIPPPIIKSFTPILDGVGAKVMITGSSLSTANSIRFNGAEAAKFTVISSTLVSVEVPVNAVPGPLSVTTLGGTSTSATEFTVIDPPIVTSILPTSGSVGTKVTITGQQFESVERVLLNDVPVNKFAVESPTSIVADIDESATNGVFKVITPGGTVVSSTSFTVIPLPTIDSFSPLFGPAGTIITVVGSNLDRASVAYVNKTRANVSAVTSTKAKVFVPNDAITGLVAIMTPFGLTASERTFEVISSSAIKDVNPSSGVAGSIVTINGWGFKSATAVLFGDVASQKVTINSNNSISAQVPYGASGGDVVVLSPSGVAVWAKQFNLTLSITGLAPEIGPPKTPVVVTGIGFTGATSVLFAGVRSEFKVVSNTTIKAIAPADGLDGPVQVITPRGSTSGPKLYFYPPEIISVTPTSGAPGDNVRIAVSRNINLSAEECVVSFAPGIRVEPVSVDQIDHVLHVVAPSGALFGPLQLSTRGGSAKSPTPFAIVGSS
jgi:hypothetical protein